MNEDAPQPGWKRWLFFPWRVWSRYSRIGGSQYAAAFAFYSFFALFPLVLLLVNLASMFVAPDDASRDITAALRDYLPIGESHQNELLKMMDQMVDSRGAVSLIAGVFLIYAAARLFKALVWGLDQAWDCEPPSWWEVPVKNLTMLAVLGSALFLGLVIPTMLRSIQAWLVDYLDSSRALFFWLITFVPALILFYGLFCFYRLVPGKLGKVRFVWRQALGTALALVMFQKFFVWVVDLSIGSFPVLYEVIGFVMALLYGTYIAGMIILLGGCACAEHAGRE